MPQFPNKPGPSDLPAEIFPEVILPDTENPDLNPNQTNEEDASQEQADSDVNEQLKRPPLRFKKRNEAIPLKSKRRKSRTRKAGNIDGVDGLDSSSSRSKDFFANDESVSNFRQRFSKPIIAVVGVMWFLGIIYLFKLGLTKNTDSPVNNNSVVLADKEPATLEEAYQRLTNQLKVADDLSELVHNRDALTRAARLRLKSLYSWNVLDLINQRNHVEMSNQLVRTTRQYIGNKDHEINIEARKGLMLLQVKEYLASPDMKFWPEINDRFDELLNAERLNSTDSENFLMLADAVAENGLAQESQQLYESITRAYAKSKDTRLANMAARASEKIAARRPSDHVFASIQSRQPANRSASSPSESGVGGDAAHASLSASQEDSVVANNPVASAQAIQAIPGNDSTVDVATAIETEDVKNGLATKRPAGAVMSEDATPELGSPEIAISTPDSVGQVEADPFSPADDGVADMQVVTSEENGTTVVTPNDSAPDRLALNPLVSEPDSKTDEALSSLTPGEIEPAPEPEIETSKSEVAVTESEWGPQIAKDVEIPAGASRNILNELESKIDDFLADRDSAIRRQDSTELDLAKVDQQRSESVDKAMALNSKLKSETELEPQLVEQISESALPLEKTEPRPDSLARNVIHRPKASKSGNVRKASGVVKEKLALYQKRVKTELQSKTVTASTLNAAIEFSDYLIEKNSVVSAKYLLEDVREAVYLIEDSSRRSQIRDRYYASKKRADYFGRPFVFNGLYDLDGKATGIDDSSQFLKLVVFWSLNSQISVELVEQIDNIQAEFKSRRVKVVAVCETKNQSARDQLRTIATANDSIEFLQLKSSDRASELFLERFPVRKYPYLLMLSAKNEVAGINVDPVFFDPIGR